MSAQTSDVMDVQKTIMDYLIENSPVPVSDSIAPEENLLDSGILDSLGIAEITEFLEKEFKIVIDEDEISAMNYGTLRKLTDFCSAKIAGRAA